MKRRVLSLICVLALALGMTPLARAAEYSDVKAGSWYYDAVQTVSDQDLMTGTSKTTFSPDAYVTRATVLTVLWRMEGAPNAVTSSMFSDVAKKDWYYTAAVWAKNLGIAEGYKDGRLGAGDLVTREQLAVFLYRYARYKSDVIAEGRLDLYSDGDRVSKWAVPGMQHALGAGLMTGTTKDTLSPLGYTTRKELAVILQRLMTPAQG